MMIEFNSKSFNDKIGINPDKVESINPIPTGGTSIVFSVDSHISVKEEYPEVLYRLNEARDKHYLIDLQRIANALERYTNASI